MHRLWVKSCYDAHCKLLKLYHTDLPIMKKILAGMIHWIERREKNNFVFLYTLFIVMFFEKLNSDEPEM